MGPWMGLLLIVVVGLPHGSECAREGRALTKNEFPETAYINRGDNMTMMHLCTGVIHDSITIVTSLSCVRDQLRKKVDGTTVRTPRNIFSNQEEAIAYPIVNFGFSGNVDESTEPPVQEAQTEDTRLYYCPRQGFFTHPDNCHWFYRCIKWDQTVPDEYAVYSVSVFECPPGGLVFDERLQTCIPASTCTNAKPEPTNDKLLAKPGSNFTFAVLNLKKPGIKVEPFDGIDDNSEPSDSTGIRAAAWITGPTDLQNIIDNGTTGAVITPDMKVVAMTLLAKKNCQEKWSHFTKNDPPGSDVLLDNAVCAIKAKDPMKKQGKFDPVLPGYVCDDDYGSPFIYEGQVLGILVRAFCDKERELPMAIFLTRLPEDDFSAVTKASNSGNITSRMTTKHVPNNSNKTAAPHNGGLSIHPNHHYSVILSTTILFIELETFHLNKLKTCYS